MHVPDAAPLHRVPDCRVALSNLDSRRHDHPRTGAPSRWDLLLRHWAISHGYSGDLVGKRRRRGAPHVRFRACQVRDHQSSSVAAHTPPVGCCPASTGVVFTWCSVSHSERPRPFWDWRAQPPSTSPRSPVSPTRPASPGLRCASRAVGSFTVP